MQAESNADSSYRSFLHYFQPAFSIPNAFVSIHTCLKSGRYRQVLLYTAPRQKKSHFRAATDDSFFFEIILTSSHKTGFGG